MADSESTQNRGDKYGQAVEDGNKTVRLVRDIVGMVSQPWTKYKEDKSKAQAVKRRYGQWEEEACSDGDDTPSQVPVLNPRPSRTISSERMHFSHLMAPALPIAPGRVCFMLWESALGWKSSTGGLAKTATRVQHLEL
jgi:hypothetical protein